MPEKTDASLVGVPPVTSRPRSLDLLLSRESSRLRKVAAALTAFHPLLGGVGMALLGAWMSLDAKAATGPAAGPVAAGPAVTVVEVSALGPAESALQAGGMVAATEVVLNSELSGLTVTEVLATVGSRVRKGQPLVLLSGGGLAAELDIAKAQLAEAQAAMGLAAANATRSRELKDSGLITEQSLAGQVAAEKMAAAKVAQAQAQVRLLEYRVSRTVIHAPTSGVVSSRAVEPGAVTQAAGELLRMVPDSGLEWRAEVPPQRLADIRANGGRATVVLPSGEAHSGAVRAILPTVDASTRAGVVVVALPPLPELRAGLYLKGSLPLARQSAAWVLPAAAVVQSPTGYRAFLVQNGTRAASVLLPAGGFQEGRYVMSTEPRVKGPYVLKGAGLLRDGDTVRVVMPAVPAVPAVPATAPPGGKPSAR